MKRLGRRTVSALSLLLAMMFATFGLWLLFQDENLHDDFGADGSAEVMPQEDAPRVVFDEPPPGPAVVPLPEAVAATDSKTPAAASAAKKAKTPGRPGFARGKVVDKAGVGVAEAVVTFRQRRRGRRARKQVTTDAYGGFVVELDPGRYVVSATKPDYAESETAWLRLRDGGDETVRPLVLPPSSALRGTVSSDGVPLAGASVSLDGRQQRKTTTDAHGRFVIDGLREGLFTVTAQLEGYVSQTERNVPVTEGGGGEIGFTLAAGGRLTGLLRKQDGSVLPRGLVFAFWEGKRLGMTRSDGQGRFEMDGLVPGPVELFARSEDYGLSTRSVTSVAAAQLTVQDLVLVLGPQITGVLRNQRGEPIVKREVRARSLTGDVRRNGKTNEQGRYVIKNLYPGRYALSVGGAGGRWGTPLLREEIEVSSGLTERDFVLPDGATVSGRVVDPQGKPVNNANVFAIVGTDYRGQARSDKAGAFSISDLPAGDYQMFIRVGDDRMVGLYAVSLQEGAVVGDLELLVRPPARLRGRVLDPQGQPLAGVVVNVRGGNSPVRRRATSAADGTFDIGPLYDGDYELRAQEGPLLLLARKWEVTSASVEPFSFAIAQGRDVQRDVLVRIEQ